MYKPISILFAQSKVCKENKYYDYLIQWRKSAMHTHFAIFFSSLHSRFFLGEVTAQILLHCALKDCN